MGIVSLISENDLILENNCLYSNVFNGKELVGYVFDNDFVLVNGDDGNNLYDDGDIKSATISFKCLARFFNGGKDPSEKDIIEALGSITIVDYEGEDTKVQKTCPGLGYVKVHSYDLHSTTEWHKSPTILFKIFYDLDIIYPYILMGVDDDQYFGCLIDASKEIKTIKDAKLELMPKHIRDTSPSKIERQGEWFFVKLDGEPNDYQGAQKVNYNCGNVSQQYCLRGRNDSEESNTHVALVDELWFVNDTYNINKGEKIPVLKDPEISHNQHPDLNLDGYWWPIENTAIQSYSEEGVD